MTGLPSFALRRRVPMLLGVVAVAVGGVAAVSAASTVEITVDGNVHEVRTYAGTVEDALDRADVLVGPDDEVDPDPSTPVDDGLSVEVMRAITVDVEVYGGVARTVTAPVTSVGEVLEIADLADLRDEGARIVPPWNEPVGDGDTVEVQVPTEMVVVADGEEQETSTFATDVASVLDEAGVEVGGDDVVLPDESAELWGPTTITVHRVDVEQETREVELEHGERRQETDDLERGTTRVDQDGEDGLRMDTYRITLVDGEQTFRERVGTEVVTEPRERVVLVGTKPPPPPPSPPAASAPSPATTGSTSGSSSAGVWDRLAQCESNGNWSADFGNGYYGGLQFHPQTWRSVGGSGLPHEASKAEQIRRGELLQQRSGWGQWPACSRRLGLG